MTSRLVLAAAIAALLFGEPVTGGPAHAARPNVIVMIVDDLGYGDVSCLTTGAVATPNLDRLAREGVTFTSGYVTAPLCAPSRAGFYAGQYPQRFGFLGNNDTLPNDIPLLPGVLKQAGYRTGLLGKWHAGGPMPHERGCFDETLCSLHSSPFIKYQHPKLARNGQAQDFEEYSTDLFAREAEEFIERNKAKPFALTIAFNAPHIDRVVKEAGRIKKDFDAGRAAGTTVDVPKQPMARPGEAARYADRFPGDTARADTVATIAALDQAVGRILDKLQATGLERNTIVFFFADNGGHPENRSENGPLRDYKWTHFEGGIRVPFFASYPGVFPAGLRYDEPVSTLDIFPTVTELAGIQPPAHLDGVDLTPHLKGDTQSPPHEALYFNTSNDRHAAIREGKWKLILEGGEAQLFDLSSDLGETRDLASQEPERVAALKAKWLAWKTQMPPAQKEAHNERPSRPNILVILADDMGFSDLGCYGSEIKTPHLDKLAQSGLRFTQFYNTGRCCPTRAALLTGLYPHQAGMGHMTDDRGQDGYRGDLNDQCVTLAEVLRETGYSTSMVGKWHVTKFTGPKTPAAERFNWPLQRGFDRFLGFLAGTSDYFAPKNLFVDNTHRRTVEPGFYTTDAFVDEAITFIAERPKDKPFFLYTAFNAPHFPVQAPREDIARYRGTYKAGWDALRTQRHARQIEMGIVDGKWPLSPRPKGVPAWDGLSAQQQERFDEMMAVYAACVERMDRAIGRLVDSLRQDGCLDNTLILFMSDNGGNAETGPNGELEGDPSAAGTKSHCGESWANLQNTPFRTFKHFNHEGGITSPLVVHWPAGISARGELRTQPAHLIDIMPTCVAVSGATYPTQRNGKSIQPMEGVSLLPAFTGQPLARDALFWEHEGNAAVRAGTWKLVRMHRKGPWELYDMHEDRTELNDLAAKEPARAQELLARWESWAERAKVLPYPTEGRDSGSKKGR